MPRRPASRRWLQMGVELEGGWDVPRSSKAAKVAGAQAKGDSSVHGMGGDPGEIITRPHAILDNLCHDIERLYPDNVNQTCGFHIHTSFSPMDYSMLMDKAFWEYYRKRWKDWGEAHEVQMSPQDNRLFWDRYKARTHEARQFCKAEFCPDDQMSRKKDRYYQLNFAAWEKYKTLESRLLPMFEDHAMAELAVREMSDIYDSYLNDCDFPVVKEEKNISQIGELVVEEVRSVLPDGSFWAEIHAEKPVRLKRGPGLEYDIQGARDLMLPWVTSVRDSEP